MKKIAKILSKPFLGKKYMQRFFEMLYTLSIRGMNFGLSEVADSGEKSVLELVKNKFPSATIFDVGANKGDYALLAHNVFGDKATIYSFEPGVGTFSELSRNTSNIKNIKRNNIGLGSSDKKETLHYDATGSGLASIYDRQLDNIDFSKKEEISITTLDSFCTKHNIKHIDLLKIDVEGYELEVLHGAHTMLAANAIHSIQFEFGGCNIDSRTYFRDFYNLLNKKYTIYRVLQNGLQEVKKYSELQEIFTTVNYFAMLK